MKNIIDSDFAEILGDELGGELSFGTENGGDVPAMISEITMQTSPEIGGIRPKRTFTATARRAAFRNGKLPKPGCLVTYGDDVFRVSLVKTRAEMPLVEIEFSEK